MYKTIVLRTAFLSLIKFLIVSYYHNIENLAVILS